MGYGNPAARITQVRKQPPATSHFVLRLIFECGIRWHVLPNLASRHEVTMFYCHSQHPQRPSCRVALNPRTLLVHIVA